MPQLDKMKIEKRTKEGHSILMDGSGSKKIRANFFDEDALFTL